jgi:hypothetical protein
MTKVVINDGQSIRSAKQGGLMTRFQSVLSLVGLVTVSLGLALVGGYGLEQANQFLMSLNDGTYDKNEFVVEGDNLLMVKTGGYAEMHINRDENGNAVSLTTIGSTIY